VQWFNGQGFADLLRSTSLYRKLDPDTREPLLDAIAERIRTEMGRPGITSLPERPPRSVGAPTDLAKADTLGLVRGPIPGDRKRAPNNVPGLSPIAGTEAFAIVAKRHSCQPIRGAVAARYVVC